VNQFINVKTMDGELKRTEIRRGMGFRLTTKEMILLREDVSYHIYLDDILGIISKEEDEEGLHKVKIGDTEVAHHFGASAYKIIVTKMRVYNRSGVIERGSSTLYTQLSDGFCKQLFELLNA
jgi:hypothetical protein